jgi:segregation and condensation protein A
MAHHDAAGEYRVRLDEFQGPLDLLLHLVRRAELDPSQIQIARIADQYIEHIERATHGEPGRVDVEVGGEFLVMAATLMEIKSRSLMPTAPAGREGPQRGEADPRAELIRQLLAYRGIREAADRLDERRRAFELRWPSARAGVDKDALRAAIEQSTDLDPEDLDVIDLVESFARIAAAVNFERLGEHRVVFDDTPIELHATDILDRLTRLERDGATPRMTFAELFAGAPRSGIIGLFLATLELTRQRRVTVEHDQQTGTTVIERRPPSDDAAELALAPIPGVTDPASPQ